MHYRLQVSGVIDRNFFQAMLLQPAHQVIVFEAIPVKGFIITANRQECFPCYRHPAECAVHALFVTECTYYRRWLLIKSVQKKPVKPPTGEIIRVYIAYIISVYLLNRQVTGMCMRKILRVGITVIL